MPKRRKVKTPARGKPWPKVVVDRAVELVDGGRRSLREAHAILLKEFIFDPKPPSRSAVGAWTQEKRAEATPDDEDEKRRKVLEVANAARLARLEVARGELSEILMQKLSRPAADLLAARLAEQGEVEQLVAAQRQVFLDAVKVLMLASSSNMDREEVAGARAAVKEARLGLAAVEMARIDVRDLVGIQTRALSDHMQIEGLGEDETDRGDLLVQLDVPRPDARRSDAEAVPQANLKLVKGGRG